MPEIDWHKCRFLESTENLKPLVRKRFGREPSSTLAREIVACLQQGRLFYEAAGSSPLEIRPLQQYYGMVGFAKAVVIASQLRGLNTLRPSHGIEDVSAPNSKIADLKVRIRTEGTFQEFNDVIASVSKVSYIDHNTVYKDVYKPAAASTRLTGIELSLREILSRIPGLGSLYEMTFDDVPLSIMLGLETLLNDDENFQIRIDELRRFDSRESLKEIVVSLRERFPFLKDWRIKAAQRAWGYSVISFRNTRAVDIDEFSAAYLAGENGNFLEAPVPDDANRPFTLETGLDPVAGGYNTGPMYAISPVSGNCISEFSIHYLGLFLLSSLVRYRPQIWTAAISRSSINGEPTDDRALSIIERFLDINLGSLPQMIVTLLNPGEDHPAN